MAWTHIRAAGGMGLEEQHVLRRCRAPVATLKPAPREGEIWEQDRWTLSMLERDGMSARTSIVLSDLSMAKSLAEKLATENGWEADDAALGTIQQANSGTAKA